MAAGTVESRHMLIRGVALLLFPLSQLCVLGLLLRYAVAFSLPLWVYAVIAVSAVLCVPVDLRLFRVLREAQDQDVAADRVRLLEDQLEAQQAHERRLQDDVREARQIATDVARELDQVDALLAHTQTDEASAGLRHAMGILDETSRSYCDHSVVDALVTLKARECERHGIETDFKIDVPSDLPFEGVELCALFANMLDNALNSCEAAAPGNRFITLRSQVKAGFFMVSMRNGCAEEGSGATDRTAQAGGIPEHGWGLSILRTLSERHDGVMKAEQEGAVFATSVMLNLSGSTACLSE